jgi:hypothetical protein
MLAYVPLIIIDLSSAAVLHPACCCRYGAPPERGPTHVDVFKDFGPAAAAAAGGGSSSGPAGASGSSAPAAAAAAAAGNAGGAPKLSDLFKPPPGLAFTGDWEAAVAQAAQQGRWLLLNVQDAEEFATHRLNRDTWGDSLVQDMLRGTFVFWQVCACLMGPMLFFQDISS